MKLLTTKQAGIVNEQINAGMSTILVKKINMQNRSSDTDT